MFPSCSHPSWPVLWFGQRPAQETAVTRQPGKTEKEMLEHYFSGHPPDRSFGSAFLTRFLCATFAGDSLQLSGRFPFYGRRVPAAGGRSPFVKSPCQLKKNFVIRRKFLSATGSIHPSFEGKQNSCIPALATWWRMVAFGALVREPGGDLKLLAAACFLPSVNRSPKPSPPPEWFRP